MTARVIDVETTGTAESDRIIEISIIDLETDIAWQRPFSTLLDPEIMIPTDATAHHGITMADIIGMPKFRDVAAQVRTLIESAEVLIGYCHDFDQGMIDAEFRRMHSEPIRWPVLVDAKRIWDVYEPKEKRSLGNAYKRFVSADGFDGAHRSLNDCRATAAVLVAQLREFGLEGRAWESIDPDRAAWWGPSFHVLLRDGKLLMNFGKHRGKLVCEVDVGFWRWLMPRDFPEHVVMLAMEASRLLDEGASAGVRPSEIDPKLIGWAMTHAQQRGWLKP
jgi:DNA polymerase-3 subunit epsilon